ncbi:MAG: ribosome biogenesis GTP-binding protein YihA/YsxC [Pseudomonadota bacterium]|jgi:GTP-binding protein|nr:ribosome biogenesis GTP-binding protein YihA/YsxC [Pseudomonadota bacterium]
MTIINFQTATFLSSAPSLSKCPPDEGIEVAFAGRSNAGKSTALNTLTKNKKLAKTSKTPGRTQLINFFSLTENQRLVDLPGYGYAKVPLEIKKKWDINLSNYLRYRQSLKGLILMMDCRHPLTRYDQQMLDWSSQTDINIHILLTKADKERNNALNATLNHVNQFIMKTEKPLKTVTAQLFSSKTKLGLTQLEEQINFWFQESSQF